MTPEERQMLRESIELGRANNQLLNKLYRSMLWGRAIKIFYWFIIIGITIGSFYFLQPYLDTLKSVYGGGASDTQDQIKAFLSF